MAVSSLPSRTPGRVVLLFLGACLVFLLPAPPSSSLKLVVKGDERRPREALEVTMHLVFLFFGGI